MSLWKLRIAPLVFAAIACAGLLAACSGVNWTITIGGCVGGTCQPAKGQAKSVQRTDATSFDASQYFMTYSATGGITSDPGFFRLDLLSGGNVVASSYFPYNRSGDNFYAADPASINAWVSTYAGQIDEFDIELDGMHVAEVDGSNTVTATSYYNGSAVGTASNTWTASVNHQNF